MLATHRTCAWCWDCLMGVKRRGSSSIWLSRAMENTDSNLAMAGTGGANIRKARQNRTHEKHMIKNCCIKGYIFGMAYISLSSNCLPSQLQQFTLHWLPTSHQSSLLPSWADFTPKPFFLLNQELLPLVFTWLDICLGSEPWQVYRCFTFFCHIGQRMSPK